MYVKKEFCMKNVKSARQKAVISFLVIIAVAVIISLANLLKLLFSFSDSDFLGLLVSLFETVGLLVSLIIAIRQLGDSKEIARAQFLTELNKSFVENEEYARLYNALQDCRDSNCKYQDECKSQQKCLLSIPKGTISNYLTFFETINLLIEDKVLTFEVVDNLFAYRFFLAIHSEFIQEAKILPQPENFINIFRLEHKWLEYRKKVGKIAKPGSVYAERCLETLFDLETYKQLIKED